MITALLTCPCDTRVPENTSSLHRRPKRHGRIPLPPFPTDAFPGTRQKVTILAERARMRVALWHPDDAAYGCHHVGAQTAM